MVAILTTRLHPPRLARDESSDIFSALAGEGVFFGRGTGPTALELSSDPNIVPLPGLSAGPVQRQLTAAHHSQNTAAFPGRQGGPVKGMGF